MERLKILQQQLEDFKKHYYLNTSLYDFYELTIPLNEIYIYANDVKKLSTDDTLHKLLEMDKIFKEEILKVLFYFS